MLLQRPKIRQFIKDFKLEEKIKDQYERMKANKQNKQPQKNVQSTQVNKFVPLNKKQDKNAVQTVQENPLKKQELQAIKPVQNENIKVNEQKKAPVTQIPERKSSISGMPEKNIILPDKSRIIEKLQPKNLINQQKKDSQPALIQDKQSQKKTKQSKQQFLKNLQKAVQHNISQRKSPIKQKNKTENILNEVVAQQKTRLQKIDMKIQQQMKKQQQIQRQRLLNQRKKSQTPNLVSPKLDKNPMIGDRKSVPSISAVQSNKQLSKYQRNPAKMIQNPMIPPLPPKNKQQIIKVKMQQPPVAPKFFDVNKGSEVKSKGIIKSKGFSQQIQQEGSCNTNSGQRRNEFKQMNSAENLKPTLFGLDEQQRQKRADNDKKQLSNKQLSQQAQKACQYQSQRNIKVSGQTEGFSSRIQVKKQPQRYLFKKKLQVSNNLNSRVRKGSSSNQISRNAKNVSKYSEVTKEDEDVVANLPVSLKKTAVDSSDQESDHRGDKSEIKMNKKFKLKQINNDLVLQKYEEIISSKSIVDQNCKIGHINPADGNNQQRQKRQQPRPTRINKNLNEYDEKYDNQSFLHQYEQQMPDSDLQRFTKKQPSIHIQNCSKGNDQMEQQQEPIEQNASLAFKNQFAHDSDDQILDESEQMIESEEKQIPENDYYAQNDLEYQAQNTVEEQIYQINKFDLDHQASRQDYENQNYQKEQNQHQSANTQLYNQSKSQWSFEQQPELPMLQDKQSPFFEQANPYLMAQHQEQTIQQKRNYLQIRLKQNMKRQDQINKLMQIKIQQCKSIVPKSFEQILQFFRRKINKEDEYTENDQKEVEQFLRKKGLTDQRKFQNIYKIMHFQMELENTTKIIQRICKKLADLDDSTEIQ